MRALIWALGNGFKKIALLGYDCSIENGTHWHGDHKNGLSNPSNEKVKEWFEQFETVAELAKNAGAEIINCSRHTELKCFKIGKLEEVLSC